MLNNLYITKDEIAFGIYGFIAGLFALTVNMDNRGKFMVYSTVVMFGVMCMIMRIIVLNDLWKETKNWSIVKNHAWPMAAYVIGTLAALNQIKIP